MKGKKNLTMTLVLCTLFFIGSSLLQAQASPKDLGLWTIYTNSPSSIPALAEYNYWGFLITGAVGDQRDFDVFASMSDGSMPQESFTMNAATGAGTGMMAFIRPGLNPGEPVYEGWSQLLEGPFIMNLAGVDREVLRVSDMPPETGGEFYYDRETGVLVQATLDAGGLMIVENESNPPPPEFVTFTLQSTNIWSNGDDGFQLPAALSDPGSNSGFKGCNHGHFHGTLSTLPARSAADGTFTKSKTTTYKCGKAWNTGRMLWTCTVTAVIIVVIQNGKIVSANPGSCEVKYVKSGANVGRVFGWDVTEDKHEATWHTETTAGHTHMGKFAAFVFYIGKLKEVTKRATVIVTVAEPGEPVEPDSHDTHDLEK